MQSELGSTTTDLGRTPCQTLNLNQEHHDQPHLTIKIQQTFQTGGEEILASENDI